MLNRCGGRTPQAGRNGAASGFQQVPTGWRGGWRTGRGSRGRPTRRRRACESSTKQQASAGLGSDYQTLPLLNFRNIASEAEAEKSLKLLENIYERVGARAGSFLSAEELAKFAEFREAAITGSRASLLVNRKMMAPGPK